VEGGGTVKLTRFERTALQAVKELDRGAYGVPLRHKLEELTGRPVAFGAIYETMDRLEERGLVRSQLEPGGPERGGRAKRYWWLPGDGFRALEEG
jgi:PadR family transcriptional regulator PadR